MSSLSTEDDLDVAWSKTLEKCQDIAKWDFKPSSRGLTVDQVIRQINPSTKDPQLKDKAKLVVSKALTCLQRFGSVIAQAASAVFGPSNQVMNGISFLISVTQDYDKVFAGFTTMMERVSAFLQRLQIYLDKQTPTVLDKRLRRSVYDVLEDFMTILAHSHRLATSKRSRFKLMASVMFFGDDDGVKDSLARLEVRIADVSRTEISVIVNDLSEAAQNLRTIEEKVDRLDATATRTEAATTRIETTTMRTEATATRTEATTLRTEATATRTEATAVRTEAGVGQIIAEQDRRIAKEQSDRNTKRIKEALKPDDKSPWLESHTSLQSQIVKSTGSWLTEGRASFERWANSEETAVSVMSIDGGEGYGKSSLCSAVVQWLLEKYPKGRSESRVGVAYYYFQRDAKEKASINRAIRDVLWQLTQYDPMYESLVGPNTGGDEDTSKTLNLWKKFIDDSSKKFNGTFFVVLDGVDEPDTDPEKPLAEIVKALLGADVVAGQLKVRMLLSGRGSGLDAIELDADSTIPRISLGTQDGSEDGPVNQTDILAYIEYRLNKMDNFRGRDNSDLKDRIKNELSDGVKGDFLTLGYKLEEIENARNVREIEQILDRANETREDAIARGISKLNETLSREEIDEVNEILNLVIGAMDVGSLGWIDTPALEGLILLKTETAALVPLATQIKTNYNALLDVSKSDFVTLASDDVKELVLAAGEESRKTLHPNAQVQDAEIAIMKRVIQTFSGEDLYQRFSFDNFFDSLTGEKARRIHVEQDMVHIRIARACLISLCDKHDDDDLKSLREYSRMYFVDHLRNIDLETASKDTLKEIGGKLSKLLMEPAFIDVWWDEEYYTHLKDDWLYYDEDDEENYMRTMTAWMSDPDVSEGWADQPSVKNWVSAAVDEENTDEHILTKVLRRLAERWFGEGATPDTFTCVHGLYGKIHQRDVDEDADITLAEIDEIVEWAQSELRDIQGEAHWNFRAAVTLKSCAYFDESISRCQKALEEEPSHWRAQLCMAEALAGKGDTSAAVDCFQKLDDLSADLLESDDVFKERYWRDMLAGLADCQVELDNLDVAANTCKKAIDHGFESLQEQVAEEDDDGQYEYWKDLNDAQAHFNYVSPAIVKLVSIWHKQKKFSETVEFLQSLDRSDTGYSGTRLAAVVQVNAFENDFHSHMRSLADSTETFKFVDDAYRSAVELSASRPLERSLSLRTSQGSLAWLCGLSQEIRDGAFDIWNAVVATENPDDDADIASERARAARQLPRALLERIKATGPGSDEAAPYMTMLEAAVTSTVEATSSDNKVAVLSLARSHHLANHDAAAKAVLADRMNGIFKDWNEESDSWWYHLLLAHTFTALNDDTNALAAWSLLAPKLSTEAEDEDGGEAKDEADENGSNDGEDADEKEAEEGSEEQESEDEPDQATAGAEASSDGEEAKTDSKETNGEKANGEVKDPDAETNGEEGSQDSHGDTDATGESSDDDDGTDAEDEEPGLQGWLHSFCDGCRKEWSYVDNIYCCRDCLDVQLEPDCYAKLKAGELDPTICGQDHDFLHLPVFVEEEWRARATEDLVKVGEVTMPRKEWLKGIRSEWGVEQEKFDQIKLTAGAVRAIEKFWKVVKARRLAQKPKRTGTGLRGASVSK